MVLRCPIARSVIGLSPDADVAQEAGTLTFQMDSDTVFLPVAATATRDS